MYFLPQDGGVTINSKDLFDINTADQTPQLLCYEKHKLETEGCLNWVRSWALELLFIFQQH